MIFDKKKKGTKKPCYFALLLLLLIPIKSFAQVTAQQLMRTGMPAEQAVLVASVFTDGAQVQNNTYIKAMNAAGSAAISMLKVDGTDDTVVNADSGDVIKYSIANTPFAQDSATTKTLNISGTTYSIITNDADASDNSIISIGAGGAVNDTRGAYAIFEGEQSGARLQLGVPATGSLQSQVGGTTLWAYNTGAVPTMAATPVIGTNVISPGLNVIPTAAANTGAFLGASTPVPGQKFEIFNNAGATVRIKGAGAATLNGASAGTWIGIAAAARMSCETITTGIQTCPFYSVNGVVAAAPTPAGP